MHLIFSKFFLFIDRCILTTVSLKKHLQHTHSRCTFTRGIVHIHGQIFHLSNEKVSTNTDVAHDRVNCLDTRSSSRENDLRLSNVQFRITDRHSCGGWAPLHPLHITSGINIKFHTMIAISLPSHQRPAGFFYCRRSCSRVINCPLAKIAIQIAVPERCRAGGTRRCLLLPREDSERIVLPG